MFRDASEELARLQAELLAEEEPIAEEVPQEEPPKEDPLEQLYENTCPSRGPAVYQNYSNDYGKELRNYASGYRAYNTDITDEDLDEYSESVREGSHSRSLTGIAIVICLLTLGIVAVAIWFAYSQGILG